MVKIIGIVALSIDTRRTGIQRMLVALLHTWRTIIKSSHAHTARQKYKRAWRARACRKPFARTEFKRVHSNSKLKSLCRRRLLLDVRTYPFLLDARTQHFLL